MRRPSAYNLLVFVSPQLIDLQITKRLIEKKAILRREVKKKKVKLEENKDVRRLCH